MADSARAESGSLPLGHTVASVQPSNADGANSNDTITALGLATRHAKRNQPDRSTDVARGGVTLDLWTQPGV